MFDIPQADFLKTAEFCKGPDLLRPGTLTGKHVDAAAIAFIYCAFSYSGDEPDIRVSSSDTCLIFWPAPMGHEKVADREPMLRALFGPDFRDATKDAAYEQAIYQTDDDGHLKHTAEGELIVIGKKLSYDALELRRLAVKHNLFGRYGRVRGVCCLMLWNQCENWEAMLDKLLVLLDVPVDGLVTMGNCNQWWMQDWRGRKPGKSAETLAEAVREEVMEFDDALLDYLLANHPERLDESFVWTLKIVIGHASMGEWHKHISLSETEESSVREIIDKFGLGPFVEPSSPERGS